MKNESGIYPCGNRVLVYVDQIEDKIKESVIELLENTRLAMQCSNASGTLVEAGPDAFCHITEAVFSPAGDLVEQRRRGYSEPFAESGDRISFAKYSGQKYKGKDGKEYLVLLDEDITCKLDDEVELSDLDIRKGVGT